MKNRALRNNLLFLCVVLGLAALLWALNPRGGTGAVAVLQYGDPAQTLRFPLNQDRLYDVDTGVYTIHLQVSDGGIAFVQSPCPDHTCEGFGTLRQSGDWAACLPARASLTIEE